MATAISTWAEKLRKQIQDLKQAGDIEDLPEKDKSQGQMKLAILKPHKALFDEVRSLASAFEGLPFEQIEEQILRHISGRFDQLLSRTNQARSPNINNPQNDLARVIDPFREVVASTALERSWIPYFLVRSEQFVEKICGDVAEIWFIRVERILFRSDLSEHPDTTCSLPRNFEGKTASNRKKGGLVFPTWGSKQPPFWSEACQ